jgi:hypothetical protein
MDALLDLFAYGGDPLNKAHTAAYERNDFVALVLIAVLECGGSCATHPPDVNATQNLPSLTALDSSQNTSQKFWHTVV